MDFITFIFYLLAAILVYSAIRVVTAKNPVTAVLHLVLAFFNAGGLWIILNAEFLGSVLVMVYIGAVMVLFLFVVMMLDIDFNRLRAGFWKFLPMGAAVGLVLAVEMGLILGGKSFGLKTQSAKTADYSNIAEIGRVLYTDYAYAFELASLVLLIAMIAAVSLTFRKRPNPKYIKPEDQVFVHPEGRVVLVKMDVVKDDDEPEADPEEEGGDK